MEVLLVFVALMVGAVVTMPVWSYSEKWKLYPSSACCGLAILEALMVVVGAI
jgi:hypothetical protein